MSELTISTFPVIGHHGTYEKNIESIFEKGFIESEDHNEWYGDGVYFFVPGLNEPVSSAKQYIEDSKSKAGNTEPICVLEATINVDNNSFLDLTQIDGLQLFNSFRAEVLAKIELIGKKPSMAFQDHDLIKSMRKELDIEFVKGNVYIRFGIQRSHGDFKSRIPNVTIFVVGNSEKNIEKSSIKKVA